MLKEGEWVWKGRRGVWEEWRSVGFGCGRDRGVWDLGVEGTEGCGVWLWAEDTWDLFHIINLETM